MSAHRTDDRAVRIGALIVSDTRSDGTREDQTLPVIAEWAASTAATVIATDIVPDEATDISEAIQRTAARDDVDVVLTSGGTGLGPRDVTPEATRAVIDRPVAGLTEMLRAGTAHHTQLAWLSRGEAGMIGTVLVINLPGSPKAVAEQLSVLGPVLQHAVAMAQGVSHQATAH